MTFNSMEEQRLENIDLKNQIKDLTAMVKDLLQQIKDGLGSRTKGDVTPNPSERKPGNVKQQVDKLNSKAPASSGFVASSSASVSPTPTPALSVKQPSSGLADLKKKGWVESAKPKAAKDTKVAPLS